MVRAEINGKTVWIDFSQTDDGKTTKCHITADRERQNTVAIASVRLFHRDMPSDDTARKYALGRAMQNMELAKTERTHVWEKYRRVYHQRELAIQNKGKAK